MKGGQQMKRVLCLYRVSTKGQVDKQDDIPVQRRECLTFIDQKDDWVFLDERLEKGISGYKVSAAKRDVILEIRSMAEKKQFDVLLVFMFDRLGRREDETPFLVQWFIENGIEVWSTREGQQLLDSRVDKLMNFMRYWQAGGESEKISMRVKAAHTQMTADGIWRGGSRPFGYKLVHNGRIGKKNRQLFDLAIDEIEGPIVQEVFKLASSDGMGTLRIANYMNDKYPHQKKIWTAQTVRTMLKNLLYTGRLHMNDTQSDPIETLKLISDTDFNFTQYAMKGRIQHRYAQQRKKENDMIPKDVLTKTSVYGATLLSGILYCAHCGHKLVGSYCTKQRKDGAYHRPIYRCYNGSVKAKNCGGQTVYSAMKIESAVLQVARQFFNSIQQSVDDVWREQARRQFRNKQIAQSKAAQTELSKLQKQQTTLRQEVMKSLNGESSFDTDLLKSMLDENKVALFEAEKKLVAYQEEKNMEDVRLQYLSEQYSNISDWAKEFDQADNDTKKMILARLIERIEIDRQYHLTIKFFITMEEFALSEPQDQSNKQHDESSPYINAIAV